MYVEMEGALDVRRNGRGPRCTSKWKGPSMYVEMEGALDVRLTAPIMTKRCYQYQVIIKSFIKSLIVQEITRLLVGSDKNRENRQ